MILEDFVIWGGGGGGLSFGVLFVVSVNMDVFALGSGMLPDSFPCLCMWLGFQGSLRRVSAYSYQLQRGTMW